MPFVHHVPMKASLLILLVFQCWSLQAQDRELLRVQRSKITFVSDAPLEYITATNEKVEGILDPNARTFALRIPMGDFNGFNSPLQREHFNENYILTRKFPNATFSGRLIEAIYLSLPGEYNGRAKGEFTLKGITRERIIPCKIMVSEEGVQVSAAFDVLLDEHDIRVPKVVQQKISSVVKVEVDVLFGSGPTSQ